MVQRLIHWARSFLNKNFVSFLQHHYGVVVPDDFPQKKQLYTTYFEPKLFGKIILGSKKKL